VQIITIFVAKFYAKNIFDMSTKGVYRIVVDTDYSEFWRYNIVVMASVIDGGEQIELLKHRDIVAEVGAELKSAPKGYNPCRRVELISQPATALTLYIYIIPHTLPVDLGYDDDIPQELLPLRVEVSRCESVIYAHTHELCILTGDNIMLRL